MPGSFLSCKKEVIIFFVNHFNLPFATEFRATFWPYHACEVSYSQELLKVLRASEMRRGSAKIWKGGLRKANWAQNSTSS